MLVFTDSQYFPSHACTSLLRLCLRFLCFHNNANVRSSASPSVTPTPAPIAASLLDDDNDDDDDDDDDAFWTEEEFGNANGVAVAVTVTVAVFVVLADVEPDVRLKITNPASMKSGAVLPLVAFMHVLLNGLTWLQQDRNCARCSCQPKVNINAPPLGLTTVPMLASRSRPSYKEEWYEIDIAERDIYHLSSTVHTPDFAMFYRCSCLY